MAFSSELKREREMGEEELLACPFLKMAPFLMVFFFFFSLAPIDGDREREMREDAGLGVQRKWCQPRRLLYALKKRRNAFQSKVRRPESWA